MSSRIYLDYCATTPVHSSVREKMLRALDVDFGNPSSMHWAGKDSKQLIDSGSCGCCQRDRMPILMRSSLPAGQPKRTTSLFSGPCACFRQTKLISSRRQLNIMPSCMLRHHLEREGYSVTYLPVDEHGLGKS